MLKVDVRNVVTAAIPAAAERAPASRADALCPAAGKVAETPLAAAYSPIVLAGMVRLMEFTLVLLIGFAIYAGYVVPMDGFAWHDAWHYLAAILGIGTLAMLAFQVADIYQVQAFRGYEKQYFRLASAWSVVFLIAIGVTFFVKVGDQYSRAWLGAFYVVGLLTLLAFRRALFLLVRSWTREGRLDRRTVVVR